MKLEEGMYIRNEDGYILNLTKENIYGYKSLIGNSNIKIKSHNIIDLIEVGDILLIKDFVDEACTIFTDIYYIQNENQLFNIKRDLEKNKNMKISKILTKEQFESMAYEVEQ